MVISLISVVKINPIVLSKTLRPNTTSLNFIMDLCIISSIELVILTRCAYKKCSSIIVILILWAFQSYHGMLFV